MRVIKRDGSSVAYDRNKIVSAIINAFEDIDGHADAYAKSKAEAIADFIEETFAETKHISVEDIQDIIEEKLCATKRRDVAASYIRYRYTKQMARTQYKDLMDAVKEKLMANNVQNQNANVDEKSFGGRMGEAFDLVEKKFALENIISPMARENHENNMIYIHDFSHYALGDHNCLSIPIDKLLAEGFNTRQIDVRPANSVNTAMQLVAVIFQLQSLQQFGGVSATHLDWSMVPYVRKSFYKHFCDGMKYVQNYAFNKEDFHPEWSIEDVNYKKYSKAYQYAYDMTEKEVHQAVEGMYHNLKY